MLYQNFLKTIEENGLFEAGDNLVVGVSGGVDSVVLLHLLLHLKDELGIFIHVAHVNYGLRGKDSDDDEKFVKNLCDKNELSFINKRITLPDDLENLQLEARNLRFDFFAEVASKVQADAIVLGQHLDDQVETVLMHLIRGSSLKGLRGMDLKSKFKNFNLIRPLLQFSREDIVKYARKNAIEWREDVTNQKLIYTRNTMRHKVLPLLREINPKVDASIYHMSQTVKEDDDSLYEIAKGFARDHFAASPDSVSFSRKAFLTLPPGIRKRALILAYENLNGKRADLLSDHIEHMDHIAKRESTGKEYQLPCDIHFSATPDKLILNRL